MALPTGPIPRVALDEIIEENWGDSVAQSLNNLAQRRDASNWKPTADINAPTASTMTVWFNFGGGAGTDITVPDWAQNAYARMEINGVEDLGSPNGTYDLQLFIGTTGGRIIRQTATSDDGFFPIGWTDRIDVSDLAGARKLIVKVAKVSGAAIAANWKISTNSDIAFDIEYSGAIDFYPGI